MIKDLPAFVRRRFDPAARYGLRTTLFALALTLVAVPFGWLLDQVVRKGGFLAHDTAIAKFLHEWIAGKDAVIWIFTAITWLGKPEWFFLLVASVCGFLLYRRRYRLMTFLLTTSIVGGIIDSIVKIVVNRDRPSFENPLIPLHGKSFPSGHAMSSTVIYGALLLVFMPLIPKRRRPWAVAGVALFVLTIGFTRLALGVHFVSDVLGGFALGLAWLAASVGAFSIWREERGRRPVAAIKGLEPEAKPDLKRHTG